MKKIIILSFLLIYPNVCFPVSETILLKSGEKIVYEWQKIFNQKHFYASCDYGTCCVYRSSLIGLLGYDIKKTDSIVSPYILIISGNARWDNNLNSPFANNYSELSGKNMGFRTKEEALKHKTEKDFKSENTRFYNIFISYAFQDGAWVFNKFNSDFFDFLNENSSKDIKKEAFKLDFFPVE